MKQLVYIFTAFAAMLSVSCSKASTDTEKNEEYTFVPMTFNLIREDVQSDSQTKAYFKDGWVELWWKNGDEISVFPGNSKMTNTLQDGHNAVFSDLAAVAYSHTLLYPYNADAADKTNGAIETVIPTVQTLGEGQTCDPHALLSACKVEGEVENAVRLARLKNYFSLVVVQIKGDDVVSVTLEGNNGEILAGKVFIDLDAATVTGADASAGGATAVTLKPSGETFKEGEYGIAIVPTSFTKGFKIIYKHSGSKKAAIKSTSSDKYTVARNYGLRLPSFTLTDADYKYYYLLTAADLDEWQGDADNWASSDVVYLGADIDYARNEFSRKGSQIAFTGTFNGRKHSIYNIRLFGQNTRAGLFYELAGTVKNLCIGSSDYNWETGEGHYDGKSESYITGAGAASTIWYYAGGIAAYVQEGGKIENCVNFANVYANYQTSTKDQQIRIGGIAGTMKGGTTIKDCKNFGNVTMSVGQYVVGSSAVEAGGITSRFDGDGSTLTGCSNYGIVTNSCLGLRHLGGIVAVITNSGTFANNHNYGTVRNEAAIVNSESGGYLQIGGVAGYISNAQVENLTNHGAIQSASGISISLEIGGVVGEIVGGFNGCNNEGPITVDGNVNELYAGGVAAWVETVADSPISNCNNMATGSITVAPGVTVAKQIWAGGVIGGQKKNISSSCTNLVNRAAITFGSDASPIVTSNTSFSYIGGVAGGNDATAIAYENCENYGAIYYKGKHKCRIGGITAFASKDPTGCICKANIRFYGTKGGTNKSEVGGIVGFYSAPASNGTFTDCLYKGNLVTYASSPRAFTGMLVGRQNDNPCTFSGCKVGGQVKGVGSIFNTVALVCCAVNSHEINVVNLVVDNGTKRHDSTISKLLLNYGTEGSTASVGVLCGGTTTATGTETQIAASTGNMTNCTIGTVN